MKKDWLEPYIKNVGKKVHLKGMTSTSKDVKVALGFALDEEKEQHIAVLFMIGNQNFVGPNGIFMNHECYSSYPAESELLLQEGCPVHILSVE